ncbi:hypothetical protein, partial [Pseudomonas chlororaphis]|uniref:hypothetical protein n=1 Tax=Pseudomonas chlororaphis TaxID=587753 RepID=UPI001F27D3C3
QAAIGHVVVVLLGSLKAFGLIAACGSGYTTSATGQTGHANFRICPCIRGKTRHRLRLHWTYR